MLPTCYALRDVLISFYSDILMYSQSHFSFSFISGVSGTSLFNSVSLMAYNVFYTSIPVLVSVLDKDLSEETVLQHPQILFYCQAGRFAIMLLFSFLFCTQPSLLSFFFEFPVWCK